MPGGAIPPKTSWIKSVLRCRPKRPSYLVCMNEAIRGTEPAKALLHAAGSKAVPSPWRGETSLFSMIRLQPGPWKSRTAASAMQSSASETAGPEVTTERWR